MTLTNLSVQFNAIQQHVSELSGRKKALEERVVIHCAELEKLKAKEKLYNECLKLIQQVTQEVQEETTQKVANIVTKAYRYIFETDDEFVIKTELKRKVPSAKFLIKTKKYGKVVYLDPLEEDGGGKVDVISLGLRLAGLLLCTPSLNKVLVFDETLKFVSASNRYRERTAKFLKNVCEEYGVQIILVTHAPEFEAAAHKIFRVDQDTDGTSHVI